MRKSTRFTAIGAAVCAAVGSLTIVFASPASANHVNAPACDIFRQTYISSQTAFNNADQAYNAAVTGTANATTNLTTAGNQLIVPTYNLIKAHEDNVGIPSAQTTFNSALAFFNTAVTNYVNALTLETELKATRDINGAILPYLAGVIGQINSVFPCAVP